MDLIDTYQLATSGQNSLNTFTLASNGILVDVFIEDVPVVEIPPEIAGGGPAGLSRWLSDDREKTVKTKKRITVKAVIDGKEYTETLMVDDKPHLTVKDVSVDVNRDLDKKPSITISVKL